MSGAVDFQFLLPCFLFCLFNFISRLFIPFDNFDYFLSPLSLLSKAISLCLIGCLQQSNKTKELHEKKSCNEYRNRVWRWVNLSRTYHHINSLWRPLSKLGMSWQSRTIYERQRTGFVLLEQRKEFHFSRKWGQISTRAAFLTCTLSGTKKGTQFSSRGIWSSRFMWSWKV